MGRRAKRWHKTHVIKFFILMISLVLLLLLFPFFQNGVLGQRLLTLLVSLIAIAGVYAASYDKRYFITALILGVPFVILSWIEIILQHPVLESTLLGISIIFFIYTIYIIIRFLMHKRRVTADTIYGGVCVYLLLGILWTSLYTLAEAVSPGSFASQTGQQFTYWSDFLYFSFVTLTTLGYGDITPITSYTQSLAILEAIVGVLFLTVLIARLVSVYTSQSRR